MIWYCMVRHGTSGEVIYLDDSSYISWTIIRWQLHIWAIRATYLGGNIIVRHTSHYDTTWLFVQPELNKKGNTKAPHYRSFARRSRGVHRWPNRPQDSKIPRTKDRQCRRHYAKSFDLCFNYSGAILWVCFRSISKTNLWCGYGT